MEPIAIVGLACRFPRAPSPAAFWELLRSGGHGVGPVPPDRWDAAAMYSADPKAPGKVRGREGAFIEEIDRFDAAFFGISPREATQMDPQQRILLELAHEALEDAGVPSRSLAGSNTAVFVGVMSNDYLRHQTTEDYQRIDVHTGGGAGYALLANRLSYQLDLHGPSMSIDSACSSSLVAAFHGCQAIWTGQSDLALVGGTNLMLDPSFNVFYSKAGLLSSSGRCRTFDAGADGIVRGEGAGLLVLKRERDALRDGDLPYAVIRGGAVNHGGRSNGITAPNRWAQESLLRTAWRQADIHADALQFVELHGTGTQIGDAIEANALGAALRSDGRTRPLAVGSVKTNIGHQEGAAGVAGLIKLALSMHHRTLVPSLWFDDPSPAIDFANLPLEVSTTTRPWPTPEDGGPIVAGISSFGLGGTNAHLVLAAPTAPPPQTEDTLEAPGHLLVLSARSEPALRALAERVRARLAEGDAGEICRGALRRNLYEHRVAVTGQDGAALRDALQRFLAKEPGGPVVSASIKPPVRALRIAIPPAAPGDWTALARWLRKAPAGRSAWEACRAASAATGPSLPALAALERGATPPDAAAERLWGFAGQLGLVRQLLATVPEPSTFVACEPGQLVALCAAEAVSVEEALSWLRRGLGGAPAAGPCRVRFEHAAGDPAPGGHAEEGWEGLVDRLAPAGDAAVTVVTNVGALPVALPAGSHACLTGGADDFGSLFARLALALPLALRALGEGPITRLPTYPWQRASYWLPAPAAGAASSSRAPAAAAVPAEGAPGGERPLRARFLAAGAAEREAELRAYLRRRVGEALRMAEDQVDPAGPLNALGMDSLTAVEIKNGIERDLGISVPVVKFLEGFAIDDFVTLIADELGSGAPPSAQAAPLLRAAAVETAETDDVAARVAHLSMEEVEAMLAAMQTGGPLA